MVHFCGTVGEEETSEPSDARRFIRPMVLEGQIFELKGGCGGTSKTPVDCCGHLGLLHGAKAS